MYKQFSKPTFAIPVDFKSNIHQREIRIIAHENEIVIPYELAKELYHYLRLDKPITYSMKQRLLRLYTYTPSDTN